MVEQEALKRSIQERQDLTQQYQQRSEKLQQSLQDDQERFQLKLEAEKVWNADPAPHLINHVPVPLEQQSTEDLTDVFSCRRK